MGDGLTSQTLAPPAAPGALPERTHAAAQRLNAPPPLLPPARTPAAPHTRRVFRSAPSGLPRSAIHARPAATNTGVPPVALATGRVVERTLRGDHTFEARDREPALRASAAVHGHAPTSSPLRRGCHRPIGGCTSPWVLPSGSAAPASLVGSPNAVCAPCGRPPGLIKKSAAHGTRPPPPTPTTTRSSLRGGAGHRVGIKTRPRAEPDRRPQR